MPEVVEAGEILEDQAVAQEPAELEPGLGSRLNKKLRVTEPRSINAVTHKVACKLFLSNFFPLFPQQEISNFKLNVVVG